MSKLIDEVPNVVNGHTFTVSNRYSFKDSKIMGKGSFGVVSSAYDTRLEQSIAIKRVRPYGNDVWDAKHTLREIKLMKLLGPHPNVSLSRNNILVCYNYISNRSFHYMI